MYQVIIVDDEILVRIGIKSFIPWGYLGLELVGEANNGREALELIKECQPQIVITDIKMPEMDGLALMREVLSRKEPVNFIVLSNCEEYEYVRGAMKLGAFDYLLKRSFSPEQLQDTLIELREKLVMEQVDSPPSVAEDEERGRDFWKVMSGVGNKKLMEELALHFPTCGYTMCCFFIPKKDMGNMNLIFGILKQVSREFNSVISFRYMENEIISIIYHTQNRTWIDQYVNVAVSTVKTSVGKDCSVFISRVAWDYADMLKLYNECLLCRENWFYRKPPKIVEYEDVKGHFLLDSLDESINSSINQFLKAIDLNEIDRLQPISEEMFALYEKKQNILPKIVKNNYINIVNQCTNALKNLGFPPADIDNLFSYTDITEKVDIYELKQWLDDFFQKYVEMVGQALGDGGRNRVVAESAKYIEEHYRENISLADIAAHVNLSINYFSALFKRTTGIGVIEYLNKTRIKNAKEILANHADSNVSEVAYEVGFANLSYFSKMFKKYEGITPAEYKKKYK